MVGLCFAFAYAFPSDLLYNIPNPLNTTSLAYAYHIKVTIVSHLYITLSLVGVLHLFLCCYFAGENNQSAQVYLFNSIFYVLAFTKNIYLLWSQGNTIKFRSGVSLYVVKQSLKMAFWRPCSWQQKQTSRDV